MEILSIINTVIAILFTVCYAYQFVYIPIALLKKPKPHKETKLHDFAVLICARNEEKVIVELINSLKKQTYPKELITVFVMADNCTDATAEIAAKSGAVVYERQNKKLVGKGYALEALLKNIKSDYGDRFDGYFVFDADNILRPNYIEQMNMTFSDGYDIVTGYRNSKNYGSNWISAGYSLWFLRESQYLNRARHLIGTSCAVSGTGFMFSRRILSKINGWKYHLLTEDIEFSVAQIIDGEKIGYCREAELFDEQPIKFSQSWRQRMRWAKGYLQVFGNYGGKLVKGLFKRIFACFDITMSIMPAFVLSVIALVTNIIMASISAANGMGFFNVLSDLFHVLIGAHGILYLVGLITTITEWKYIHTTAFKKILYTFTFPLFMFTYLPISMVAVFSKVTWKPIEHGVATDVIMENKAS